MCSDFGRSDSSTASHSNADAMVSSRLWTPNELSLIERKWNWEPFPLLEVAELFELRLPRCTSCSISLSLLRKNVVGMKEDGRP